ncbi:MAG: hypothetical protein DMF88_08165 [Acidobacteria bacterium]|nr:MAG: hypothetical protein DMF88_08165 [Acidobacteriota bacterium]
MFQFLFNYPLATFSRGQLLLLAPWPAWVLWLSIAAAAAALAALIAMRIRQSVATMRSWRAGVVWLLQSSLAAVVLLLLWQPAVTVTELKPQQNIVAVVVDDSHSMAISEDGSTRQAQAVKVLQDGVLASIAKKFETRLYRLDRGVTPITDLKELHAAAPSTRIGDGLKQLVDDMSDLPVGAVVLLSDGADNTGGVDADTLAALRNRRIPIHTVGFGREQPAHDIEIDDAAVASRALADSRLAAVIRLHQHGYAGRTSKVVVRDGSKILAARDITFDRDGSLQSTSMLFNVGAAGAKALQFSIEALPGEESAANNTITRLVNVDSDRRRILYIEGEPRWEYKFVRRAEEDDRIVQLVTMLRTTENKIYRQSIQDPAELGDGFPTRAEDLFAYQAIVIGSVEATYFTAGQRELIRQFVDRRGGGLLLLGGRASLADGGWGVSDLASLLPIVPPDTKNTFHVEPATVELAPAGMDNYITRLVDDPKTNADRWKKLPYLMDYQEPGVPKPGAAVLATMDAQGRKMPMLITENFGRGRTAVLATGGTWRWQMNLPAGDPTYGLFWQQLLRWLVADSPGHVVASVPQQVLQDEGHVVLAVDVRGNDYQPVPDARVEAHIIGPNGISARLEMAPTPDTPGKFTAEWNADRRGSYLTEVTAQRRDMPLGRDVLTFQRLDGVAESFHTEQNRELLDRLASQTGGRYWKPQDLSSLADEISFSEAGVTTRTTKDLWNMPAVFLLMLALRFGEWLLRRRWGVV